MNYYNVDILTPSKVLVKDMPAESLIIPTTRGQINILSDHTHMVTRLDTGSLSIFGGADDPDRHFVMTSGLCKILDKKVTILANTAEESFEIDLERAKAAKANAEEKLKSSDNLSDDEITKYRRKAERAGLRIQMAGLADKK